MPRIAIAVPIRDEVAHLRGALQSLVGQTVPDFDIVVVDDSSLRGPEEIVLTEFAGKIGHYERNLHRRGLVGTWAHAFKIARQRNPELTYFAWGSDHDLWEPNWLAELSTELDRHPGAVLAYPLNDHIDGQGRRVREPWRFDTAGMTSVAARFAQTVRRMRAGDMVYGLVRVDALERSGVYRRVLLPDRLLMAELSLEGEFRQVPQLLWHRRVMTRSGSEARRQRSDHGGSSASSWVPWTVQHARALAFKAHRPIAASAYLVLSPAFRAARSLRNALR